MGTKLFFLCGKMAAGKSTLAARLAPENDAILLVQDHLLEALYPHVIVDIPTFVTCSARLRAAITPCVVSLLSREIPVVLDFPANTRSQRAWFRELFEAAKVGHELHFVDATDATCRRQLGERSPALPEGSPFTSDAEFDALTRYFEAPSVVEGFNVIRHVRV